MWDFPKFLPRPGHVHDPRDLTKAMQQAADRPGKLGEHNWDDALQGELTAADLDDGVCAAAHAEYTDDKIEPLLYLNSAKTATVTLFNLLTWAEIPDCSHTFTTEGGMFFVWVGGNWELSTVATESSSLKLGIMVDGNLVSESVIGNLDYTAEAAHAERGLSGAWGANDVLALIPVAPGTHTISLAVQVQGREPLATDTFVAFYTLPLFIWELKR